MTVEAQSRIKRYVYTGPGDYPFLFRIFDTTDLVIVHTSTAGVQTVLTEGGSEDYTVAIDGVDGGTVTTTYSETSGVLTIQSSLPIVQQSDLENTGPLDMEALEIALDRNTMILQEFDTILSEASVITNWKGDWVGPDELYTVRDIVEAPDGKWYYCVVAHTSTSTFATDLASGYWAVAIDTTIFTDIQTACEDAADATAADAVATAADAVATAADAASTAADAISTAADAVATAADRVQTGIDASNASDSADAAAASAASVGFPTPASNTQYNMVVQTSYSPAGWAFAPSFVKNLLINGRFDIWQEATSQTTSGYGSDDCWINEHNGSTKTHSRQAFTVGQTDVPYNPKYFSRTVVTSVAGAANYVRKRHRIEDVTKLSGKGVALTFYGKADASKYIAITIRQNFGSGGSSEVTTVGEPAQLTTSWQKHTKFFTFPSVSGKTIGAGSYSEIIIYFDAGSDHLMESIAIGQQSGTFDLADFMLVPGITGMPIEITDEHTELAKCQRYYQQHSVNPMGFATAAGQYVGQTVLFPVAMRTTPTATFTYYGHTNINTATIIVQPLSTTDMRVYAKSSGAASIVEVVVVVVLKAQL